MRYRRKGEKDEKTRLRRNNTILEIIGRILKQIFFDVWVDFLDFFFLMMVTLSHFIYTKKRSGVKEKIVRG